MKKQKDFTIDDFGIRSNTLLKSESDHNIYFRHFSTELTLDTPIFRYMKLEYLLEMLIKKQLFVSNRSCFSDLRDKCAKEKCRDKGKLRFGSSPATNNKNKQWLKQIEDEKEALKELCISCWTLDNIYDNRVDENILMWKSYRDGDLMCRVGTTIRKLIDNIVPTCDIIISDICYDSNPRGGLISMYTFHKLPYYSPEMEVRLVMCKRTTESQIVELKNVMEMIDTITLSPFISPRLEHIILKTLEESFPMLSNKIQPSKIMEYTIC